MPTKVPNLRTSERITFKRCPQRWWWGYREGLRPINQPSNALWFGTGIHLALAQWYQPGLKRGRDLQETWAEYCKDEKRFIWTQPGFSEEDEAEYIEAQELGDTMLESYVDEYGHDESWHVLAPEQAFQVLIPGPDGKPLIEYDGTFDGVYLDLEDDQIKLMEHKTAAQISIKHLSLDDQAGSYWAIATHTLRESGLIRPKQVLSGITYNFLRKAKPDDRPRNEDGMALNKDGSVSKRQPVKNFQREFVSRTKYERKTQIKKIQAEAQHMAAIRQGDLPLYKNPTKDCNWDCPFFDMCELHDSTPDWKEFRDVMFRVEDPYKDHRKSA